MVKRVFGVAIMVLAMAACTKSPPPAPSGQGGFGSEAPTKSTGMGMGGDSSAFRTIYFDFDSSDLRADARDGLQANASYLKSNSTVAVTIAGSCDERGSAEYNLALGKRRADAAYKYLADLGVSSSRMTTISYGKERPAVEGHNELAWAKNRRDEFTTR
ncbi:MAG: peptidoglycan-associated lipoprotein Pal [Myxococcota bacterium]